MLAGLFTSVVATAEVVPQNADESLLWRQEASALGRVVAKRRHDFVAGRRCAQLAMAQLGETRAPVLIGERREPLWPTGLVGSITHTRGLAAAAIARRSTTIGLGIDAEPDEPLPDDVVEAVAHGEEREWAAGDPDRPNAGRLLFCIKEAVYKVWYPMAKSWLGFEDVRVAIETAGESFTVDVLRDGPLRRLTGRYAIGSGLIVAAIELSVEESSRR